MYKRIKSKTYGFFSYLTVPIILLFLYVSAYFFYDLSLPVILVRFFGALWFLIWYKKIITIYYQAFESGIGKDGFTIIQPKKYGDDRPTSSNYQGIIPQQFLDLSRKVSISKASRNFFVNWLILEGASEEVTLKYGNKPAKEKGFKRAKNSVLQIITGKQKDRVNEKDIKEAFSEVYNHKKR